MILAFFTPGFFGTPGPLELIIIVIVILVIVRFANRSSRGRNQKNSGTNVSGNGKKYPEVPYPQQPKRLKPRPRMARPERPQKVRSFGCLFALLGLSMAGLFVVAVVLCLFIGRATTFPAQRMLETISDPGNRYVQPDSTNWAGTPSSLSNFPPGVPGVTIENSTTGQKVSVHTGSQSRTPMTFALIFVFVVVAFIAALVVISIVMMANRASRKKYLKEDSYNNGNPDSDSMAYRTSARPPVQKIGLMPWVIVGMTFAVGLIVVLLGLFFVAKPTLVPTPPGQELALKQNPQQGSSAHLAEANLAAYDTMMTMHTSTSSPVELIDVPIESVKEPTKEPAEEIVKESTNEPESETAAPDVPENIDKSMEELDKQLDGSNASLLIESLLRAALKSFHEDTSQEVVETPDNPGAEAVVSEAAKDGTVAEKEATEPPVSAVRKFTRALAAELPEEVDEATALQSLGGFLGQVIAATSQKRPDWVDQPSGVDPKTNLYRTVVTVGPYQTQSECYRHLDGELQNAVEEYAELYLGPVARGHVNLSKDQLRGLIHLTFEEKISTSVGRMFNMHVELAFNSATQALLQERFRESLVQERVEWSSIALGCVSLFLLGTFAVLKLEPLYRRRVLIAVAVSVVILLGLGILAVA